VADAEFARIALPHLDAAYALARWLVRDRAAAEDVVQDAMVRALTYFASFRGGDARAWLLRIVRNTAYDRIARLRCAKEDPLDQDGAHAALAAPEADPEAAFAAGEDQARLRKALEALPVELRECLVLRELEELSYRDIARITEVPVGTVMSRLFRARRMLIEAGQRAGAKERLA
jgi:RNA polymerase sigma-70 factor (ECF subfamily)